MLYKTGAILTLSLVMTSSLTFLFSSLALFEGDTGFITGSEGDTGFIMGSEGDTGFIVSLANEEDTDF